MTKKTILVAALSLLFLLPCLLLGMTGKQIYEQKSKGVVLITAQEPGAEYSSMGTGSIITKDGLVITNNHVIYNKETGKPYPRIGIYLKPDKLTGKNSNDLKKFYPGQVVEYNPEYDLAVLRIKGKIPADGYTVLEFGDSRNIGPGDQTFAIGHPEQGGFWTLTSGIISNVLFDYRGVKGWDLFQMETSINRGNSGGPLFDQQGYIIGINSMTARKSEEDGLAITGINFAIMSGTAVEWLNSKGINIHYGKQKKANTGSGKNTTAVQEKQLLVKPAGKITQPVVYILGVIFLIVIISVFLLFGRQRQKKVQSPEQESADFCKKCAAMIEDGRVETAAKEIKEKKNSLHEPCRDMVDGLLNQIQERQKQAEKLYPEAEKAAEELNLNLSVAKLEAALAQNSEHAKAANLLGKLKLSMKTEAFRLVPEKSGKEIVIFKKDVITFARPDAETPDVAINDRRVSRDKHLKIYILGNKAIAEDMGSANGVMCAGEKIQKAEINEGDIIDVAGAYKMVMHIVKAVESTAAARGMDSIYSSKASMADMSVSTKASFAGSTDTGTKGGISGMFIEADDKNFAVVANRVPVSFKQLDIIYEESAKDCFLQVEGALALFAGGKGILLAPGMDFSYKGNKYLVK